MVITWLDSAEGDPDESIPSLWTAFHRTGSRTCHGFVVDRSSPDRRFTVEIMLDAWPARVMLADAYAPAVAEAGIGDGHHGFAFTLPDSLGDAVVVTARLANLGTPVGSPIDLSRTRPDPARAPAGAIQWTGGLDLEGWVVPNGRENETWITLDIDGARTITVLADRWRSIGSDEILVPGRGFAASLPPDLADGSAHRVRATVNGRPLEGSPLSVTAFATVDAVRAALRSLSSADGPLARFLPRSAPFSAYDPARFAPPDLAPADPLAMAVVLLGPDGPEAAQESLLAQSHQLWAAMNASDDRGPLSFDPEALRAFLGEEGADAAVVVLAPATFLFAPGTLAALAEAAQAHPDGVLFYGDFDHADAGGYHHPVLLPAFDEVRLTEQGYCALVFAARTDAVLVALDAAPQNAFDLFFAVLSGKGGRTGSVRHLPRVLGSLAPSPAALIESLAAASGAYLARHAHGSPATKTVSNTAKKGRASAKRSPVEDGSSPILGRQSGALFPALRVRRSSATEGTARTLSVIVPTRDDSGQLRACLASVDQADPAWMKEIIVADEGSQDLDAITHLEALAAAGTRVLRHEAGRSRASLLNAAARLATAELVCILDGRARVETPDLFSELAARLSDPRVGAVGALVADPIGIVAHGGWVLNEALGAVPAFTDHMVAENGYGDALRVARRCSAVSDVCLMTRRDAFIAPQFEAEASGQSVAGFDAARFPAAFSDVDFCLRLAAAGRWIVWSPHARVTWAPPPPLPAPVVARAAAALRARWPAALAHDPFYHPALGASGPPYAALNLGPGDGGTRIPCAPRPSGHLVP